MQNNNNQKKTNNNDMSALTQSSFNPFDNLKNDDNDDDMSALTQSSFNPFAHLKNVSTNNINHAQKQNNAHIPQETKQLLSKTFLQDLDRDLPLGQKPEAYDNLDFIKQQVDITTKFVNADLREREQKHPELNGDTKIEHNKQQEQPKYSFTDELTQLKEENIRKKTEAHRRFKENIILMTKQHLKKQWEMMHPNENEEQTRLENPNISTSTMKNGQ